MLHTRHLLIRLRWILVTAISLACLNTMSGQPSGVQASGINYGQALEAPLPAVGRSIEFLDWDGDGLLDYLSLSHPRYTSAELREGWSMISVLRNVGTADHPRFASIEQRRPVLHHPLLGFHFALTDYDGDGKKEMVSVKANRLRIFQPGPEPWTPNWTVHEAVVAGQTDFDLELDVQEASPTIGVMDWDGDGREDLLFGINQHRVMKRGFGTNPATMNPLAARVYVSRNVSIDATPRYEKPVIVNAGNKPVEAFGWVYPVSADVSHDGLPDLILGEHRPGLRVYLNSGTRKQPQFTQALILEDGSADLPPTALAFQARPADLDGDGQMELITTSYFGSPSLVSRYEQIATDDATGTWTSHGFLPMQAHAGTPLAGPGISTPAPVDWDGDGDTDLLVGGEPGTPMVFINIGTDAAKVFAAPIRLKWTDGSPLETYSSKLGDGSHHGPKEWFDDRSTPRAVDWDRDGVLDLVSGTQGRRLHWMKGRKIAGEVRFESPQIFQLDDEDMLHPHRCFPAVIDWDGDGWSDIVGFNTNSDLIIYRGAGDSDLAVFAELHDTAGVAISASLIIKDPNFSNSRSGRSGIDAVDWDGDGITDLITFKHYFDGSVLFHRGVDDRTFEPGVKLFDFFSHLAGPSLIDWDSDGHIDLLMGGDYRRLGGLSHQMPTDERAHYFVYDGRSLPVPSAKRANR